jgi:hypothetical protein
MGNRLGNTRVINRTYEKGDWSHLAYLPIFELCFWA